MSGDAAAVANRVAATLGIDDVRADITPQGKHDCVKALQAEGALVAMVGDGVNDAPVLAQAQVSVAMGGGAQLARTQSDFVLLSENLDQGETAHDPLQLYTDRSCTTARCRKPKFEVGGSRQHGSVRSRSPSSGEFAVSASKPTFGSAPGAAPSVSYKRYS